MLSFYICLSFCSMYMLYMNRSEIKGLLTPHYYKEKKFIDNMSQSEIKTEISKVGRLPNPFSSKDDNKKIIEEIKYSNSLLSDLQDETNKELSYLNDNKITEKEEKLKDLGFTNSEDYDYVLTDDDEFLISKIPHYLERYGNFISEKSLGKIKNMTQVSENEYPYNIPEQILDKMSKFVIDNNDKILLVEKNRGFVNAYTSFSDIKRVCSSDGALSYNASCYISEIKVGGLFITNTDISNYLNEKDLSSYGGSYFKLEDGKKVLIYREKDIDDFLEFNEFKKVHVIETVYLESVKGGYVVIAEWTDKTKEK